MPPWLSARSKPNRFGASAGEWGYQRNPELLRTLRSLARTLAPFGNYTFAFARNRRSNQTSVTIAAATSQMPSNAVPAGKVKKAR
jgi:hypothetical protein